MNLEPIDRLTSSLHRLKDDLTDALNEADAAIDEAVMVKVALEDDDDFCGDAWYETGTPGATLRVERPDTGVELHYNGNGTLVGVMIPLEG